MKIDSALFGSLKAPEKDRCIVVVRLSTTSWHDKGGMHFKRSLRFLKRQCHNHNFLIEDADAIGARDTWDRIINMNECADGLYSVVTVNERRDRETGDIDDYDFKLIPFASNPKNRLTAR